MRRFLPFLLPVLFLTAAKALPPGPAELYGDLFTQVQGSGLLPDGKDFVDRVPKRAPAEIMTDYAREKDAPGFDLAAFVRQNFDPPRSTVEVRAHIESLWGQLTRDASHAPEMGSLLALPHPYVVPGGRFEELYYWDSYFVMLGLMEGGHVDQVQEMVDDFASEIEANGFIPNANRTYYLSRSQPPFFSLMVDLLATARGESIYGKYLPALKREYTFWMDPAGGRTVQVGDVVLNRYADRKFTPREEEYLADMKLSATTKRNPAELFHELRSGAESGWDFSSRWFADGKSRATIRTTELVPVDLNCLLQHLETTLARASQINGDPTAAERYSDTAKKRAGAINILCWSKKAAWYEDYDPATKAPVEEMTLAGMEPFFLKVAPEDRGGVAARTIAAHFLQPGGVVTTLRRTGEQWDAPNGWAPLQWITIEGLRNYGESRLAKEIAQRWIRQNLRVYEATGKLMEKYDVMDLSRPGGGGEYPTQDGFGWTNGVLLKLLNLYGDP